MRTLLFLFCVAAIAYGCHKPDQVGRNSTGDGNSDNTTIPATESVNTEIIGYVTNNQNQLLTGSSLIHLISGNNSVGTYTLLGNGIFNTASIITDKYRTRTLVETGGGGNYMNTEQAYPLTSSVKNYVRVKVLSWSNIGSVRNDVGGVFSLANGGGSITFGINTFYQTPTGIYLGYFGPEITSDIYATYLNPEDKDFALRLPCYLAGDDDQKRWFLKSYGAITMKMLSVDNIDFYNGGKADLKLQIPASMQADAPDSVNAWLLVNGTWSKSGWAKRQGNFYNAKIGKVDAWTFAEPVQGVYITVNLRTDSNATITNTAVRIKSHNRVIAESRTDADGNAICFVPTHEPLSAEIVPDERIFSPNTYTYPIGTITKASTVSVKMSNTTPELSSIIANVLNCNGEIVNNGIAKIMFDALGTEYYIPVKNGRFATAMWLYGTNNGIRIQVTNNATGTQGEITPFVLFNEDIQRICVYDCQNSSLLYCNYSIDNKVYESRNNANLPSVFMTASKTNQFSPVTIRTSNNNLGINFTTTAIFRIMVTTGLVTDLVVNGVPYNYDPSISPTISITRFDPNLNGYIEGYIILYYRDNANVQHQLNGNFKVKKTF
jgi:hypothetical protein